MEDDLAKAPYDRKRGIPIREGYEMHVEEDTPKKTKDTKKKRKSAAPNFSEELSVSGRKRNVRIGEISQRHYAGGFQEVSDQ